MASESAARDDVLDDPNENAALRPQADGFVEPMRRRLTAGSIDRGVFSVTMASDRTLVSHGATGKLSSG